MKKIILLVAMFVMVAGCAGVIQNNGWNSSNTEATITSLARVAGGLVLLNNKDIACDISRVLGQLSNGEIQDVAVSMAMAYLFERYGQNEELLVLFPLLINDLKTLPDVELTDMSEEALQAFQDGFNGSMQTFGIDCST